MEREAGLLFASVIQTPPAEIVIVSLYYFPKLNKKYFIDLSLLQPYAPIKFPDRKNLSFQWLIC